MKISTAAKKGRLDMLRALRDNIAATLDEGVAARDLAALSRRLIDIDGELRAAETQEEGDDIAEASATPSAAFDPY